MPQLRLTLIALLLAVAGFGGVPSAWGEEELNAQAARALRRAVEFYRDKVAAHGGYVYRL